MPNAQFSPLLLINSHRACSAAFEIGHSLKACTSHFASPQNDSLMMHVPRTCPISGTYGNAWISLQPGLFG